MGTAIRLSLFVIASTIQLKRRIRWLLNETNPDATNKVNSPLAARLQSKQVIKASRHLQAALRRALNVHGKPAVKAAPIPIAVANLKQTSPFKRNRRIFTERRFRFYNL
jgi:hypothetical protein